MCELTIDESLEERKLLSEELRFLYDKHLDLFNVRREHEWKVFFGMITLIGLSSAALLNYHIRLDNGQKNLWVVGVAILFLVHFFYQKGIQRRNRVDRLVMDEATRHLCAAMKLDSDCFIRLAVDTGGEKQVVAGNVRNPAPWYSLRYIWAFALQNVTLLLICFISYFIAWGRLTVEKQPSDKPEVTVILKQPATKPDVSVSTLNTAH